MIWILPAIFVLVHTPQGDHVRSYEGQSQETIQFLLAGEGKTGNFITQKQYDDYILANQPPSILPDPIKEQAKLDLNNKTKTVTQRLNALVTYLDLDK